MAERKTQSGRSGSVNRKKTQRRRPVPGKYMIPQLLLLVFVVLAVFEGNVIYTLFTHRIGSKIEVVSDGGPADSSTTVTADSSGTGTVPAVDVTDSLQNGTTPDAGLAGLASTVVSSPVKEEEVVSDPYRISEEIDSPAVVKETAPPVDDSYFANAVFIGDSRMEGFRNASGITQGTFLTAIGLNSSDMGKQIISTSDGTDYIVSSSMSSLILAQLSESPELIKVFQEILSNDGNELFLRTAEELGCTGKQTIRSLRGILCRKRCILLGLLGGTADSPESLFNPPLDQELDLKPEDQLIILCEQ